MDVSKFSTDKKADCVKVWVCSLYLPDKAFAGNFGSNKPPHEVLFSNSLSEYVSKTTGIDTYRGAIYHSILKDGGKGERLTSRFGDVFLNKRECEKHYKNRAAEVLEQVKFAKIKVNAKFKRAEDKLSKIINT